MTAPSQTAPGQIITRVGVLDSGIEPSLQYHVDNSCAFHWRAQRQHIEMSAATDDQLGHGSTITKAILKIAPMARVHIAQVFHEKWVTTPEQVASAIDWLVTQKVQIINMSLGLRSDRQVVRSACARASEHGVMLVAASPAHGDTVYPASYPGVLRATGDARCQQGQYSYLNTRQADFGGHVRSPDEKVAGASVASAYLTGHIAQYLNEESTLRPADIYKRLKSQAHFIGPEMRFK